MRQEAFGELQKADGGGERYDVDFQRSEIVFSGRRPLTGRADLLASIAVEPPSLLWGFSDFFASNHGPHPAATRVRDFGQQHQLAELVHDEVPYADQPLDDPTDAIVHLTHDVGMMGVEIFGPDHLYYSFKTGDAGSRMVVLVSGLSTDVAKPTLADALVKLPRLVPTVDDVEWSLGGLAALSGWRFDTRADSSPQQLYSRLTDATGAWITVDVTRDELRRVTSVRVGGVNQL